MFFVSASPLAVSMTAEPVIRAFTAAPWFTNSMLVSVLVALGILLWARLSTRQMKLVPAGAQNLFEALIEGLYGTFESVVGRHMAPKVFPLLATLFIFILASNWFGLLPGVGTIGFIEAGTERGAFFSAHHIDTPLLRPATADMNMTVAMALIFMVLWFWWSVREMGVWGFLKHLFGPKGGLHGFIAVALVPIFLFVGVIEVVSTLFRPISLSLRLFGNIYAGETLLHTMLSIGDALPPPLPAILSIAAPLPFYFLELLVGLLQATVFSLLCAVYIQLSTTHDEEDH